MYRSKHQGANIPNVVRTLSVTFLLPYDLGVFKFACFNEIRPRGARSAIAEGILRVSALILNFNNLARISKECLESPRCCICKSFNHLSCHKMWQLPKWMLKMHRVLLTPLSWSVFLILFTATITTFIGISRCNLPFVFCVTAFNSILFWYLVYVQSNCTVSPACFDWIPESSFFQFIVYAVRKDQSSRIKCPGWPLTSGC